MSKRKQLELDASWEELQRAILDQAIGHRILVAVRKDKNWRSREWKLVYASDAGKELCPLCRNHLLATLPPEQELETFWVYDVPGDKAQQQYCVNQGIGKPPTREEAHFEPVVIVHSTVPGHITREASEQQREQILEIAATEGRLTVDSEELTGIARTPMGLV